jgi:hypothetical protein
MPDQGFRNWLKSRLLWRTSKKDSCRTRANFIQVLVRKRDRAAESTSLSIGPARKERLCPCLYRDCDSMGKQARIASYSIRQDILDAYECAYGHRRMIRILLGQQCGCLKCQFSVWHERNVSDVRVIILCIWCPCSSVLHARDEDNVQDAEVQDTGSGTRPCRRSKAKQRSSTKSSTRQSSLEGPTRTLHQPCE